LDTTDSISQTSCPGRIRADQVTSNDRIGCRILQTDTRPIIAADQVALANRTNDGAIAIVDFDAFLHETKVDRARGVGTDVVIEDLGIARPVDPDAIDARSRDYVAMSRRRSTDNVSIG
jgi:hypothetical protein